MGLTWGVARVVKVSAVFSVRQAILLFQASQAQAHHPRHQRHQRRQALAHLIMRNLLAEVMRLTLHGSMAQFAPRSVPVPTSLAPLMCRQVRRIHGGINRPVSFRMLPVVIGIVLWSVFPEAALQEHPARSLQELQLACASTHPQTSAERRNSLSTFQFQGTSLCECAGSLVLPVATCQI